MIYDLLPNISLYLVSFVWKCFLKINGSADGDVFQRFVRQNVAHFLVIFRLRINVASELMETRFFIGACFLCGLVDFITDAHLKRLSQNGNTEIENSS